MIVLPFGSVASGFLTETVGRKKAMIFVNAPFAIGWIVLYYSKTLMSIYAAFVFHGLAMGLLEAPIFSYIGEICEPAIRGILSASSGFAATLAIALVYVLGSETSWRNAGIELQCQ